MNVVGEIIFWIFVAVTVGSAGVVVFSRKLIYAVFALLFTFFGIAGLYVFLQADFLAAVQLVIYVGGVLVLMLFGVMLTNRIADIRISHSTRNLLVGGGATLLLFVILVVTVLNEHWSPLNMPFQGNTVNEIGQLLMGKWLLPFEVASMLLLAALVGAAMLARRSDQSGDDA